MRWLLPQLNYVPYAIMLCQRDPVGHRYLLREALPCRRPFVQAELCRHRPVRRIQRLQTIAAADLSTLQLSSDLNIVAAGLLGAAGLASAVFFGAKALQENPPTEIEERVMAQRSAEAPRRENAVLVFGSTGKMGSSLVKQLLKGGRTVVAATRDAEKAQEIFHQLGLTSAVPGGGSPGLATEGRVDITDRDSLQRKDLWQGVSQVAIAVGPIFGRQADGQMGYKDNMTSERVDAQGVSNIVAAAKSMLPSTSGRQAELVLPMRTASDLTSWERLDDVIMGGQSSSKLEPVEDGVVWSGQLVVEGGGFCGARIKGLKLDLSAYDGIALRVKGDGQMYKINLKTLERGDDPESTYAATFETPNGDWQTVFIPFREFVPVVRAKYDPTAPPLNPATVRQLGFRLSRFDFNNLANPKYKAGPFKLEIQGGIQAFKDVRPSVVLVSSSAVERNAVIGDDAEARKRDIPIVQLNPGSILNYKYMGEMALRSSGLPYTVIRPVGLTSEVEHISFLLEASQGDRISGKITRAEAASIVAAALQTPASTGMTIEVRRSEAAASKGRKSSPEDLERLFLGAVEDWNRPKRGLPPMPAVAPPPPPPTEERVKQILANPEVQAAAQRARQRETAKIEPDSAEAASQAPSHQDEVENGKTGQVSSKEEAKEWIRDWRARTPDVNLQGEELALEK